MPSEKRNTIARRNFIRDTSLAAAGFFIVPRHVLGRGFTAPSDKLNIAGKVVFTGKVEYDQVVKYHNMIDIFVNVSRNESFGVAVLEASACEKPVVVSNVGGLPDLVPKGVGLVAEPDAKDIAEKIIQFFQLGENYFLPHLREEKKKYSWANMINAITDLAAK